MMERVQVVAAICLALCAGCQSSNIFSGGLGDDAEQRLAEIATSSGETTPARPGLPPPTNVDPRPSSEPAVSAEEQLRRGEEQLSRNNYQRARRHFEQVLAAEPEHSTAHHRLGVVCDQLGDFDEAERHYEAALKHDPRNVSLLSDLGYSYWLQGRFSESERFLQEARRIDPHHEVAIANLGMLYGTTDRPNEALAMFRQIGDEAQVRRMMKQVAALSPGPESPAASAAPMTPASVAEHASSLQLGNVSPGDRSQDLSQVNEPTRRLLELMEQGRKQQQRTRQPEQAASTSSPARPPVPAFAQNRPPIPQSQARQLSGVDPFQHPSRTSRPVEQRPIPDHLLNQAMSEIDRAGTSLHTGPLTIGQRTSPHLANARHQGTGGRSKLGQTRPGSATAPAAQRDVPDEAMRPSDRTTATSGIAASHRPGPPMKGQAVESMQPWWNSQPGASPQTHDLAKTASPDQRQNSTAEITYGQPHATASQERERPNNPWAADEPDSPAAGQPDLAHRSADTRNPDSAVQQASATGPDHAVDWFRDSSSSNESMVEHALHEQEPGSAAPIDLVDGQTAAPNAAARPTNDVPRMERGTASKPYAAAPRTMDSNDSYQQARRQAAVMGLGVGPGQMFPYIQQTQRATPETDSRRNGAMSPQPERSRASEMPRADLDPSFSASEATDLVPPQHGSGSGDRLPHVVTPVTYPPPYRATSSAGRQQPQQQANAASRSEETLRSYDEVRQRESRQSSGSVNHAHGRSPQSATAGRAGPQTQTAGPPAHSQTTVPTGRLRATEPGGESASAASTWTPPPYQPTTTPAPDPAASQAAKTDSSQIVIPEPYRPQEPGTLVKPYDERDADSSSPRSFSYEGPVIVPAER